MGAPPRKLKGPARAIIPLAVSAALHAGALIGIPAVRAWMNERPTPALPAKEPLLEGPASSLPDAQQLKQRRQEYLSELLSALRKGKEVSLPEFFIKSEALDRSVKLAEEGKPPINEERHLAKFNSLARRAREHVKGKKHRLKALYEFFHTEVMRGYYKESRTILDMLDSEWGNCQASTQLFSSLVDDVLGLKQKFLLFDDHITSFIGGSQIENTSHTWEDSVQPYGGCGAVLPRDIVVAAYLLKNGVSLESLPWRLQKHYRVKREWPAKCGPFPPKGGFSSGASGFPRLAVNSGMHAPDEPVPNPDFSKGDPSKSEELARYARAVDSFHRLSSLESGKQGGGEAEFTPVDFPRNFDWELFLDRMKSGFIFSRIMELYPSEYRCTNKVYSVNELEVLKIMSSLPQNAGVDVRAALCSKYTQYVEAASIQQLIKDFPYGFCREARERVMERYLEERFYSAKTDGELDDFYPALSLEYLGDYILLHLVNYARPGDFGFFLNEYTKREGKDTRLFASYGMAASDSARACGGAFNDAEGLLDITVIGCHSEEEVWASLPKSRKPDVRGLTFLRGSYLTEKQVEELRHMGLQWSREGKGIALMKLSRIFGEYSDTLPFSDPNKRYYYQVGHRLARESAGILSKKKDEEDLFFIEIPPHHIDEFRGLMEDYDTVVEFSASAACVGKEEDLTEKTIDMLRGIVVADYWSFESRMRAALVLLELGRDPLE